MAGFEVVVRPVVFPDIRPAPAQPVPPADDPEQGFATISGNGAKTVGLSYSYSSSASSSQRTEIQRRYDEARVYQMDDNGKVNKENFVDIQVANKIWMKGPPAFTVKNFETAGMDTAPFWGGTNKGIYYYTRIKDGKNIEVRKKDLHKKPGEQGYDTPA